MTKESKIIYCREEQIKLDNLVLTKEVRINIKFAYQIFKARIRICTQITFFLSYFHILQLCTVISFYDLVQYVVSTL